MAPKSPTLLLVEDDAKLASLVREYLEANGMEVTIESRGDRAVSRILAMKPDCVVLDVMLPGMDGFEICKRVRSQFAAPIMMLTARCEEVDEVLGLEIGADDYLMKPVRPRVLLTRIRCLLRRTSSELVDDGPAELKVGALTVHRNTRQVTLRGSQLEMTTCEFDLLAYLAKNVGNVVTRAELYDSLRGIPYDGVDRSIDLNIARLRKKLGDSAKQPHWIKSVRGTGYLMAAHQ